MVSVGPDRPSDPGHEIAARQMRWFGAMLSCCLESEDAAEKALQRMELIAIATSLGGVESLAERRNRWPAEQEPVRLIRLSVGIEHVEDIWADLDQVLG